MTGRDPDHRETALGATKLEGGLITASAARLRRGYATKHLQVVDKDLSEEK